MSYALCLDKQLLDITFNRIQKAISITRLKLVFEQKMLSKQIQILISFISVSLWDREVRDGKGRNKKKTLKDILRIFASDQCEHTFYQFADEGLSRRTWLNFCCQTVLWSKTTPIKEERSRTFWKKVESVGRHSLLDLVLLLLLVGLDDPKGLCQPKRFYHCWFFVFWYSKLPNQWRAALADWWEKCSVIALKH